MASMSYLFLFFCGILDVFTVWVRLLAGMEQGPEATPLLRGNGPGKSLWLYHVDIPCE